MKIKKWYYIIILFFVVISAWSIRVQYLYSTYAQRSFVELTGIKKFDVKTNIHNGNDCFIETIISSQDRQKMLDKFKFVNTPINLNGNAQCNYVPKNESDYLYLLDDKGHGLYAYNLYMLSKTNNTFIVYQQLGD
jgi:hypothetical protein